MVAGSVWGCHRDEGKREIGFAETWHSTPGQIEITALAHNNTILILDETKRAGRTDLWSASRLSWMSRLVLRSTGRKIGLIIRGRLVLGACIS